MKPFLPLALILLVAFALGSCEASRLTKQAENHYLAGRPESAAQDAVSALRISPKKEEAIAVYTRAYPEAAAAIRTQVESLPEAEQARFDDLSSYQQTLKKLIWFQRLSNEVSLLKNGLNTLVEVYDVRGGIQQTNTLCAEALYKQAQHLMGLGGVDNNKQAAKYLHELGQVYVPGYKDSKQLFERARQSGIKRIAILPFDNKSGQQQYGNVSDIITDRVISTVLNTPGATMFLDVISRDQLDRVLAEQSLQVSGVVDESTMTELGKILGIHEFVVGQVSLISASRPALLKDELLETQKVVTGEKEVVRKDGTKAKEAIYGEVQAKVSRQKWVCNANLSVSYKIISVESSKVIKSNIFNPNQEWSHTWGKYTGDKRALSRESAALVTRGEQVPPTETERVLHLSESVAKSISKEIIEYAK